MPRSYSFDHFQVPKREPDERAGAPDAVKAATAGKGEAAPPPPASSGAPQYGQAHSETVRRFQEKAEQRRAEEAQAGTAPQGVPTPAQTSGAERPAPKRPAAKEQPAAKKAPARKAAARKGAAKKGAGGRLGRVAAAAKKTLKATAKKAGRGSPKRR